METVGSVSPSAKSAVFSGSSPDIASVSPLSGSSSGRLSSVITSVSSAGIVVSGSVAGSAGTVSSMEGSVSAVVSTMGSVAAFVSSAGSVSSGSVSSSPEII